MYSDTYRTAWLSPPQIHRDALFSDSLFSDSLFKAVTRICFPTAIFHKLFRHKLSHFSVLSCTASALLSMCGGSNHYIYIFFIFYIYIYIYYNNTYTLLIFQICGAIGCFILKLWRVSSTFLISILSRTWQKISQTIGKFDQDRYLSIRLC